MIAKRPVHLTGNQISEVDAEKPEAVLFQYTLPELLTYCVIIIRVEERRCNIEDTKASPQSLLVLILLPKLWRLLCLSWCLQG
jgi:hypothetical protein